MDHRLFQDISDRGKAGSRKSLAHGCVWFVFSDFLQLQLDKVKSEWNMHFIRQSRHNSVSGVPDELYYLPETRGFEDCGFEVSADDVENILNQRDIYGQAELAKDVDDDLFEYFKYVVREGLSHPPQDWRQARDMYEKIVQLAES